MTALVDFVMPSLGADMDEGTVTEWLVAPGDRVRRGQIVAIVETDKADIDVEVWQPGVVTELLVEPGRTVPVGTPLAHLEVEGAGASPQPVRATEPLAATAPIAVAPPPVAPASPPMTVVPPPIAAGAVGPGASPLARRLASERGLDLTRLTGTGPGGAVVARDLDGPGSATVAAPAAPPTPEERRRRVIADLMARSKREIPHYYLSTELDVEVALQWLEATNAGRPVEQRLLPAALLMRAIALALAEHPELNGFWVDDRFVPADGVHLGVAVSLRSGGLVAPAIHDADHLGAEQLMARLHDLVTRARSGRLRGSEMTDATVTVTNLGDRGVEVVFGVIHPPQVALVGLGRITARPAVDGDRIVVRRQVTATLSADHRASDGQRGARFLNTVNRLLQRPEDLT